MKGVFDKVDDLVTVIVPVYQVKLHLLKKCLNSVLDQTYENYELIICDDGMEDNLLNYCKDIDKANSNIKIIGDGLNRGVSYARNQGIKESQGKWGIFLDADDYIDNDAIEMLLREVKMKRECDVIITNIYRELGGKTRLATPFSEKTELSRAEFQRKVLSIQNNIQFVCGKLWNFEKIRNEKIFFNEGVKIAEDALFCIRASEKMTKFIGVNSAFYHYLLNMNSAVRKFDKHYCDNLYHATSCIRHLAEDNVIDKQDYYNYGAYNMMSVAVNYCFHNNNPQSGIYSLKKASSLPVFKEAIQNATCEGMSITRKITMLLLKQKLYIPVKAICKYRRRQLERIINTESLIRF